VDALRAHRHFLKLEDICSKQDQETARQKRMTIRGEGLLLDLAFLGSSLCGEKNREQVELMQLNRGETGCEEYLAKLSPKEMLEAKLHEAIRVAKGQVERESKNGSGCLARVLACYRRFFVLPGAACSRL